MTYPDSTPQGAGAEGALWVFNAPPGWPAVPAGWQPPPGWQPDPSWPAAPPDWEYWRPAALAGPPQGGVHAGQHPDRPVATAGELRLLVDGRSYSFQPGQAVRIGRAPDNDVLLSEPTVSRQHARLVWADGGWTFESIGQAATWLDGQPVTRVAVTGPLDLALGSAQGPVLRVEAPTATGPQAAQAAGPPFRHGDHGPGHVAVHPTDELAEAIHILFPLRSWLHTSGLVRGLRLLVIVYALLPLVFLALFASAGSLTTPGWAYSLYIAPLWAIGFWQLIRPGRIRPLEIWVGAGIIAWVLVWINVVTVHVNQSLYSPGQSLSPLAAIGVGFNEEITKGLPILVAGLVLLRFRSTKLDVRMWMFLGTVAGLTFGVFEQAFYTSQDILLINQARVSSQAVEAVLAFAERVFVDGFQHAVWAGISAFFIGMAVNYRRRRVLLIIVGVSLPALLHGLNDWSQVAFDSVWPSIIIQAVSLLLFLGYTMSATTIEQEVRETPLFRGESAIMEAVDRHRHHQ
jgi:RsiW-degrading membrane proteinase PrsW (M82 family)